MTAATVIGLLATQASGAAGAPSPSTSVSSVAAAVRVTAPEKCPGARQAVRFYQRRIAEHRAKMGAAVRVEMPGRGNRRPVGCPRYLAHVLQRKARAWRLRVEAWLEHHWAWRRWLPANWLAVAICESGHNPPNWAHDSGTYVSAFGIYRPGYVDDAHRIGALSWDETIAKLKRIPTPREQYNAALSHYREHGDGWGCPGP